MGATHKHINTNIDVMSATEIRGQLFRLFQARLLPEVIQEYTIAHVKKQPDNQHSPTNHCRQLITTSVHVSKCLTTISEHSKYWSRVTGNVQAR